MQCFFVLGRVPVIISVIISVITLWVKPTQCFFLHGVGCVPVEIGHTGRATSVRPVIIFLKFCLNSLYGNLAKNIQIKVRSFAFVAYEALNERAVYMYFQLAPLHALL